MQALPNSGPVAQAFESILRLEIGSPLSDTEQTALSRLMDEATQQMDEIAQAWAFGEGRSLTLAEAIQYAMLEEAG